MLLYVKVIIKNSNAKKCSLNRVRFCFLYEPWCKLLKVW